MKNYYDNVNTAKIDGKSLTDIVLVDFEDCEHDYCGFCDSQGKKIVAMFTDVASNGEAITVCEECFETEECEYYALHGHAEDDNPEWIAQCKICNEGNDNG